MANCTSGATVSLVLTATPPPPTSGLSILAFSSTITGVALTPAGGGNNVSVTLNATTYVAEFNRVTSETALLASQVSVPPGNYSQMVVTFSAPRVTFCTQPNPGVQGCATGTLTSVMGPAGSVTVPMTVTVAANQLTGLAINFNLGTALTQNGQTVTGADFTMANSISVATLPSSANDLAAGQLAHLNDVLGVVTTVSSPAVTIQTALRGNVTATQNSNTSFECTGQNFSCVTANNIAVVDGTLNSDGSVTLTFYESITPAADWLEGAVATVPDSVNNQFTIAVTDAAFNPNNSVLRGQLNLGDLVVVTLEGSAQPFGIIDKGMGQTLPANSFSGSTSVSTILPGMTVGFPVTKFTPQSGNTPGATSTTTFSLRFTRVTTTMVTPSLPDFSVSGSSFPPFFGITSNQQMRTFNGRLSVDGASNLTSIAAGATVSASALYLGPTSLPQFAAQTVRAH